MTKEEVAAVATKSAGGCGPKAFFIVIFILLAAVFGFNFGFGYYGESCGDEPIFECIDRIMKDIEDGEEKSMVTASGPYSYKGNSITMTLDIPLDGGEVEGKVTGDCTGRVTGTFDGKENGVLSGNFNGSCSPFFVNIPARATLNGTVIQKAKSVPIGFQGSGGGFTHSDSMTLSY